MGKIKTRDGQIFEPKKRRIQQRSEELKAVLVGKIPSCSNCALLFNLYEQEQTSFYCPFNRLGAGIHFSVHIDGADELCCVWYTTEYQSHAN